MDYRAGMFVYALAFLLGDIFVQQLSGLPTHTTLLAILSSILLLFVCSLVVEKKYKARIFYKELLLSIVLMILFLLGLSYSSIYAEQQLADRLDESLVGKSLLISGFVSEIPVANGHVQRFTFDITDIKNLSPESRVNMQANLTDHLPRKVRLSWYYGQKVSASEKWQFEVRLKPPHGFMNPGGFDYESWLFQHGIDATGYVRKSNLNKHIRNQSQDMQIGSINRYRQDIAEFIDSIRDKNSDNSNRSYIESLSLVKALAIGDKSSISYLQWQVLINTGTSHLMAISGLHVGLAALFAYVILRRLVPSFIAKRFPAQHVALIGGLLVAFLYALIAGLSIPTQRAIIMLFVVSMMLLIRRNHRSVDALGFALLVVLIIDPLSVLAVGFWFSFAAVAVIFVSLRSGIPKQGSVDDSVTNKVVRTLRQWVRLQLTISLFLLPLSLFMFQQVSLVSPVANLLLIPYVSFLVVPVVLLALVFTFLLPGFAEYLFLIAAYMIDWVWSLLTYISEQPYALWIQGDVGIGKLITVTAVIYLVYFMVTKGFLSRLKYSKYVYCVCFFIPIVMMIPLFESDDTYLKPGEYRVTVLDVGQGSATVLQTQNHVFVFDAGAKFSDKLDAGRSVVIPYLRSQGVKILDYLIISHGDNDHIGGAQAIIDEYPMTTLLGQDIGDLQAADKIKCVENFAWQWDGVDFVFLSPSIQHPSIQNSSLSKVKRNNRSCVLRVSSVYGSILFTGDIEKKVERKLLKRYRQQLATDILIVPHHGSNTSSSNAFLNAVNPEYSLFSVGYKNRYKLPSKKALNRYGSLKTRIIETAKSGAITVTFSDINGVEITKFRDNSRKYWNHRIN